MRKQFAFLLLLLAIVILPACALGGEDAIATLTYATMHPEKMDRSAVDRFNRTHEDVQIEILDYSGEDTSNSRRGESRLFEEIAAGHIPDIIDLTGLSYQVLAQKGYLENLWPYIENDSELGLEGVWKAPLNAAEINGKLYEVFDYVCVDTLVGAENVVGKRTSWTLTELLDTFYTMPEDSSIVQYCSTKANMFPYVFKMRLDSYVDWESGQCSFDCDDFRAAMEFVNSFPLDVDNFHEDPNEEIAKRLLDGRQMLGQVVLYRPLQVQVFDAVYGNSGRASFVGYPTEDGSMGSSFYFTFSHHRVAMSASCRNKSSAWEFIREILLPQYATKNDDQILATQLHGIPVNYSDFERLIQADMSSAARDQTMGVHALPSVKCHPATQEEVARYLDFINSINKIQIYNNVIYDIVYEQVQPYFAGDRTLDETVDLIHRRVTLYVNENR